ncbi:MAG: GH3 auxin-responsive promoter family protein [Bacteroidales bacterium]|nr:GH3 auxin-responsive promoter family protein [Candidatus Cryptobacteroides caccocaballi]
MNTAMLKANFLLGMAGGIQYRALVKASESPRSASAQTLRAILEYTKDSVYGKEHNFDKVLAATSDDELFKLYAENVKPNDYEDLRPYVERHKHGEENILFPGKPVLYATTSGSTAEPKWIPITETYLKTVYGKMTKVWLYNFIQNRKKVFSGKILSIVGKVIEGYAPDGTVFGSVSGVTQRDAPGFVKALYTNPQCVYSIADYNARYYVLMRMGIEQDVTLLVTANPSTIVELQNNVNRFYDEYVEDIEKGTLSAKVQIDPEIRKELEACLKPNPERAAELRALKAKYGNVLPKHYWPNIQILNTWKCGNTRVYLDKFADSFPDTMLHQEFGYFSSECRFGLVMDDTLNTVMFPHYHYYEFVAEEDLDNPNPKFYQIDELVCGKRYCPYVTTFAGLYRYDMHDIIEAGPCFHKTPTVHMIQKVNGIVTITGEKLYEKQFIDAVHEAEKQTGLMTRFFIGFANLEASNYDFYYEFANLDTTQEQAEDFTKHVDENLKKMNVEYLAKRDSLRLKDANTHRLIRESFETFKAQCIAEGARDGQFKLLLLLQDEKRHAKFKKLTID